MAEDEETDPIGDFEEELHEAIDGLVKKYGDMMAVKWTAVIHFLDTDTDEGIWLASSPNTMPWDVLGMLRYASVRQDAKLAARSSED